MKLLNATINSLTQVVDSLMYLNGVQHPQAKDIYRSLNIGRHVRHIHDHFLALEKGRENQLINYNLRNRDSAIEKDLGYAIIAFNKLILNVRLLDNNDEKVEIISEIDCTLTISQSFSSSFSRELLYLINHTIHHIAYIKLLLKSVNIDLPEHIGIAPSTASFLREQVVLCAP